MTALVISLFVINVAAWIVLFVRWRKLFSTDDVIAKTRAEMDNMIRDIDRAAMRDVSLIEDGERKIRRLLDELDRRLALAQTEKVKSASASVLMSTVSSKSGQSARRAADSYKRNGARLSANDTRPAPNEAYSVTDAGKRLAKRQHSLFDENSASVKTTDEAEVLQNGASYMKIPVMEPPNVHVSETPVKPKKNFRDAVLELSELGLGVEEIAKRLSRSQIEVQTVLDLL